MKWPGAFAVFLLAARLPAAGPEIRVDIAAAAQAGCCGEGELRPLLGAEFQPAAVAHAAQGREYGYITALRERQRRSVVLIPGAAAVTFEYRSTAEPPCWSAAEGAIVEPASRCGAAGEGEHAMVHVLPLAPGAAPARLKGTDMAGAAVNGWAVVFATSATPQSGALSFDVPGKGPARIVVAGLAPGAWEVWRNGWLEEGDFVAEPAGLLYLEANAGQFFLRKR